MSFRASVSLEGFFELRIDPIKLLQGSPWIAPVATVCCQKGLFVFQYVDWNSTFSTYGPVVWYDMPFSMFGRRPKLPPNKEWVKRPEVL